MKITEIFETTMPPGREMGENMPAWFVFLRQHPDALRYLDLTPNSSADAIFSISLDDIEQAYQSAEMDGNRDWALQLASAYFIMRDGKV